MNLLQHRRLIHFAQRLHSARLLATTFILLAVSSTASADPWSFWHKFHLDYHRNRAWPDPFTELDAMQTIAPFQVMKHNGWRAHNTIGNDLFRTGDGALLAAGRKRIEWIATRAPAGRNAIFVLQANNRDETQRRVQSVQKALSDFQVDGPPSQVLVTNIDPPTQSGQMVIKITRDRLEQMPSPVLPSTTASGTAGATATSGGP